MSQIKSFLIILLPLLVSHAGAETTLQPAPYKVEKVGKLESKALREASGMASSRRRDDLLWLHNDSGAGPELHAVGVDGEKLGKLRLRKGTQRDWEDMASFEYEGRPMLLIADAGDNGAQRRHVWLHAVEEPVVPAEGLPKGSEATVAWSIPFRYPDGPADCEAMAVDVERGRVLLLTKRERPPRLYELPLRPADAKPGAGKVIDATLLGPLPTLPPPTAREMLDDPVRSSYLSQPTAMDLAGDTLLVLTYLHAYQFVREPEQSWAEAVLAEPDIIRLPKMKQSESLAFDRAGQDAFVTSEKRPAPLYRLVRTSGADE